jgi:hypothetical protein
MVKRILTTVFHVNCCSSVHCERSLYTHVFVMIRTESFPQSFPPQIEKRTTASQRCGGLPPSKQMRQFLIFKAPGEITECERAEAANRTSARMPRSVQRTCAQTYSGPTKQRECSRPRCIAAHAHLAGDLHSFSRKVRRLCLISRPEETVLAIGPPTGAGDRQVIMQIRICLERLVPRPQLSAEDALTAAFLFLLPAGRPRRLVPGADASARANHAGGRPRRFPLPSARRSIVRIASSICLRSCRKSSRIFPISTEFPPAAIEATCLASRSDYAARSALRAVGDPARRDSSR